MIWSLVGIATCGLLGPVGIVIGMLATREISASKGTQSGRDRAIAAIILGGIGLAWIIWLIIYIYGIATPSGS